MAEGNKNTRCCLGSHLYRKQATSLAAITFLTPIPSQAYIPNSPSPKTYGVKDMNNPMHCNGCSDCGSPTALFPPATNQSALWSGPIRCLFRPRRGENTWPQQRQRIQLKVPCLCSIPLRMYHTSNNCPGYLPTWSCFLRSCQSVAPNPDGRTCLSRRCCPVDGIIHATAERPAERCNPRRQQEAMRLENSFIC